MERHDLVTGVDDLLILGVEVLPGAEKVLKGTRGVAGAAELIGGLAVLPDRTRPAARWWLLATLLGVYWANVHMALRPHKFPRFKPALLYARLPVQGLFAWLTWRGTQERGS
jgi:uncharacterized membrane protein